MRRFLGAAAITAVSILGAQDALDLGDPVSLRIASLRKAKDWTGLAGYMETLTPTQRGKQLFTWMEALNQSPRWERLLEVCNACIPQLEAKTGPKLGLPRLLRPGPGKGGSRPSGKPSAEHRPCGSVSRIPTQGCLQGRSEALKAFGRTVLVGASGGSGSFLVSNPLPPPNPIPR